MFLLFALLRCLERHWTVVLQPTSDVVYIFNSIGVFELNPHTRFVHALPATTWFLVDSNATLHDVPRKLTMCQGFVLQAASPRSVCTAWQDKRSGFASVYLMNPMPLREAQLA